MLHNQGFQAAVGSSSASITPDIVECVAGMGLYPARKTEITRARALAADLIGRDIATTATLWRVQAVSRGSVLVARRASPQGAVGVAGVLATLLLRAAGRRAIETGRFDGVNVDISLIARPGEPPAAFYAWGIAAIDKEAARSLVAGAAGLSRLFSFIPRFARAATEAGARTLTDRMGYQPVSGVADLFWLPAETVR